MNIDKDFEWKEKDGYYSVEKYIKKYGGEGDKETEIAIPAVYRGLPVKEIADAAFSMNTVVEKVIIPDSVEKIGTMAFNQCTNLNIDGLSKGLKRLGYFAFNQTQARQNPAFKVGPMFIIDGWLISVDDTAEEIEIPPTVRGIADYAFYFCGKLKKIIIPPTVKYIGMDAFAFGLDLDEVYIPAGVEAHWKTFGANINIKKLTIPQSLYEGQQFAPSVSIGEVTLL